MQAVFLAVLPVLSGVLGHGCRARIRILGPKHYYSMVGWRRCISTSVTFTPVSGKGRLKIPLMKSPSHLGHFSSRVNRMYNEDRYSAGVLDVNGSKIFNFNIFDGHGGGQCSDFLTDNLGQHVENANGLAAVDEAGDKPREKLIKTYAKNVGGYWKRWFRHRKQNFAGMAKAGLQLSKIDHSLDLGMRIPMSFLEADYAFFGQEDNRLGSTCTSVFLETIYSEDGASGTKELYYFGRKTVSLLSVAQVGDTKAILVDKNGDAHALTEAHHPSNPLEASRLRKYAANFFMTDSFGEERFISLANTRAFGDVEYKQMGVTAEPDISQCIIGDGQVIRHKLTADEIKNYTVGGLGGDESFLVLCTDGVTGLLTDQEIADIVMVHVNMKGTPRATPQMGAEEVIKFVEYVGGDDNATCMVIRLGGWGHWPIEDRTGELRQQRMNDGRRLDR